MTGVPPLPPRAPKVRFFNWAWPPSGALSGRPWWLRRPTGTRRSSRRTRRGGRPPAWGRARTARAPVVARTPPTGWQTGVCGGVRTPVRGRWCGAARRRPPRHEGGATATPRSAAAGHAAAAGGGPRSPRAAAIAVGAVAAALGVHVLPLPLPPPPEKEDLRTVAVLVATAAAAGGGCNATTSSAAAAAEVAVATTATATAAASTAATAAATTADASLVYWLLVALGVQPRPRRPVGGAEMWRPASALAEPVTARCAALSQYAAAG